jgi:hypothetical protein
MLFALVSLPATAQTLTQQPLPLDVPVSVAESEAWSWFGLPHGPAEACGVAFGMPPSAGTETSATAQPVALAAQAAVVYAVVSPVVESQLAAVVFERDAGETLRVPVEECALVWAAAPPRSRRLLLARAEGGITRVTPHGCYLFALLSGDATAAADTDLVAQYARGQAEWGARYRLEAPPVVGLREVVAAIPEERLCVLPPSGGEPAALSMALGRTGLKRKLLQLTDEELLDPTVLSAQRVPVALYVGAEAHLRTIHQPNDAAEAVIRYVREGGAIVMTTSLPFPTYYAVDAGQPAGEPNQPLLRRLGIDIIAGFERPPEGAKLALHSVAGQTVLPSLPPGWSFPDRGDLRLRSFGPTGQGVRMTPLVEVRAADGRMIGPAAALFELEGGGAILYVWSGIMNDARVADLAACDLLRWVAGRLGDSGD